MKTSVACWLIIFALLGEDAQAQTLTSAAPVPTVSYEAQRARIEQERGLAQTRFDQAAVLCYQRFAVNDCLRDARDLRRDVFANLRQQSLAVRDAQARQKAAER